MDKPTVVSYVRTCDSCPAQWEATLEDGCMAYIRYRWGTLRVSISNEPTKDIKDAVTGNVVFAQSVGDSFDGYMSGVEMVERTSSVLSWADVI